MNITKNQIDELNANLVIEVCKADYTGDVEKQLKKYQHSAQIPGFRKGKAPMAMIKKMYEGGLTAEVINNLLSENLDKYIKENNLHIMGQPMPSENAKPVDMNAETQEFSYDIALSPEVNVTLTKRDKLVTYNITVTDEMVEKQIAAICEQNGSLVDADECTDNEYLKGKIEELGKEQGIVKEDTSISIYYIKDEDIKKSFKGKKVGDVVTFNAAKAYPNPTDLAAMLGVEKDKLDNAGPDFNFTIAEIKRHQPAELGNELFARTYGDAVKNVDEFKAKVKTDIENQLKGHSEYRFTIDAKNKLMNKNASIQLPEKFLKRWIVAVNKDMTDDQIDKDFEGFRDEFKWQVIKSAVLRANDAKVEDSDLKNSAREVAAAQLQQYGLYGLTYEQLDDFAMRLMQDPKQREQLFDKAMDNKVYEIVKNSVKLEEQEISIEDFQKLFEK